MQKDDRMESFFLAETLKCVETCVICFELSGLDLDGPFFVNMYDSNSSYFHLPTSVVSAYRYLYLIQDNDNDLDLLDNVSICVGLSFTPPKLTLGTSARL